MTLTSWLIGVTTETWPLISTNVPSARSQGSATPYFVATKWEERFLAGCEPYKRLSLFTHAFSFHNGLNMARMFRMVPQFSSLYT